jgi:hypothetical protein
VTGPRAIPELQSLSVPSEGIRAGDVILRLPSVDDVDAILPAFTDPEIREAGNLPAFGREELLGLASGPGVAR